MTETNEPLGVEIEKISRIPRDNTCNLFFLSADLSLFAFALDKYSVLMQSIHDTMNP